MNQWSFSQFLECRVPPHKCKAPRRNATPPIENFREAVLPKLQQQRQTMKEFVALID